MSPIIRKCLKTPKTYNKNKLHCVTLFAKAEPSVYLWLWRWESSWRFEKISIYIFLLYYILAPQYDLFTSTWHTGVEYSQLNWAEQRTAQFWVPSRRAGEPSGGSSLIGSASNWFAEPESWLSFCELTMTWVCCCQPNFAAFCNFSCFWESCQDILL